MSSTESSPATRVQYKGSGYPAGAQRSATPSGGSSMDELFVQPTTTLTGNRPIVHPVQGRMTVPVGFGNFHGLSGGGAYDPSPNSAGPGYNTYGLAGLDPTISGVDLLIDHLFDLWKLNTVIEDGVLRYGGAPMTQSGTVDHDSFVANLPTFDERSGQSKIMIYSSGDDPNVWYELMRALTLCNNDFPLWSSISAAGVPVGKFHRTASVNSMGLAQQGEELASFVPGLEYYKVASASGKKVTTLPQYYGWLGEIPYLDKQMFGEDVTEAMNGHGWGFSFLGAPGTAKNEAGDICWPLLGSDDGSGGYTGRNARANGEVRNGFYFCYDIAAAYQLTYPRTGGLGHPMTAMMGTIRLMNVEFDLDSSGNLALYLSAPSDQFLLQDWVEDGVTVAPASSFIRGKFKPIDVDMVDNQAGYQRLFLNSEVSLIPDDEGVYGSGQITHNGAPRITTGIPDEPIKLYFQRAGDGFNDLNAAPTDATAYMSVVGEASNGTATGQVRRATLSMPGNGKMYYATVYHKSNNTHPDIQVVFHGDNYVQLFSPGGTVIHTNPSASDISDLAVANEKGDLSIIKSPITGFISGQTYGFSVNTNFGENNGSEMVFIRFRVMDVPGSGEIALYKFITNTPLFDLAAQFDDIYDQEIFTDGDEMSIQFCTGYVVRGGEKYNFGSLVGPTQDKDRT